MTDRLPAPSTVPDAAADLAGETASGVGDADVVNVLVAGPRHRTAGPAGVSVDEIELDDGAYRGPTSGALGRLAAATAALHEGNGVCLHYPDPEFGAPGPWLVVEPLAGRLATVARGRATVTVEMAPPAGHLDARLRGCSDRLTAVIEAARPRHEHYPVERDELGAFTRGLTAVELEHVSVGAEFTATLGALTTPHTRPGGLEERFRAVEGVERVDVDVETAVEDASPSTRLRAAVEDAAAAVVGDWSYEWLARPTAFGEVPSGDKMALGTGEPSAGRFDRAAFETGRELLVEAVANLERDGP